MPKAEGKVFEFFGREVIQKDFLEVIEFEKVDQYIKTATDEFSAVCPFSGLPDYGKLIVEYYPDSGVIFELKSFKYYMTSYRNAGVYQEEATKIIFDDLKELLKTDRLKVTTIYNTRGGFDTTSIMGKLD